MESRDIQIEKFNEFVPENDFDFDFKKAHSKGYSSSEENITLKYLNLQNKYNRALSLFLKDELSIEQLDNTLKNLDVISVPKTSFTNINSTESYYQNISYLSSKYMYLRNNIRLERLKEADVELLKTFDLENRTEKEKIMEMISRTYVDVLSVEFDNQKNENYKVVYNNNGKETVNNRTIVFWLSYQEEFDDSGNYVDQGKEKEKRKILQKLTTEYSLLFSQELNCTINIFVHDNSF
ncbi:hypothetical protein ACWOFR_01925 [Carnobacterium gallinarum]